jgi:hypothetical protein
VSKIIETKRVRRKRRRRRRKREGRVWEKERGRAENIPVAEGEVSKALKSLRPIHCTLRLPISTTRTNMFTETSLCKTF